VTGRCRKLLQCPVPSGLPVLQFNIGDARIAAIVGLPYRPFAKNFQRI
jgi:hypothetical protein